MSSVVDLLSGARVVEKVESPINGKIQVVKSLAFGTYIQVAGLTQSGGVMRDVWKTTLKKIRGRRLDVKNCLILGLGGGDAARLVRKFWPARAGEPESKIVGVEIDPIMVELGKKYLGLDESGVEIVSQDAYEFCTKYNIQDARFDLILVDVYVGYEVPEKFRSEEFIRRVKSLVSKRGVAIFNRLYHGDKRREAEIFHRKLIDTFRRVRPIYPEANVMFVCEK